VRALKLLLICFSLLLLNGALGLKFKSQCDNPSDGHIPTTGERITCYHLAATTQAYLGYEDQALSDCATIITTFGSGNYAPDSDIVKRAELETNNCFFDVARITGKPQICTQYVIQRSDWGTSLFGEDSTQELCKEEAQRVADSRNITNIHKNSICVLAFALPLVVLGISIFRNKSA